MFITAANVGRFLLNFFVGLLAAILTIVVLVIAWIIYLPDSLRSSLVVGIWVFALYAVGKTIVDLIRKEKPCASSNPVISTNSTL